LAIPINCNYLTIHTYDKIVSENIMEKINYRGFIISINTQSFKPCARMSPSKTSSLELAITF
jgi:hypothetical protein